MVQSVVNSFGVEILVGFSAAMRVESLIIVPITSLGNAVSSYTSQNVGAEKLDRLGQGLRASLMMVGIYSLMVLGILKINSSNIIAFFMNEKSSSLAIETSKAYLDFFVGRHSDEVFLVKLEGWDVEDKNRVIFNNPCLFEIVLLHKIKQVFDGLFLGLGNCTGQISY